VQAAHGGDTRVKDRDSGQWTDRPNYFDVTVWGVRASARYLRVARPARGRPARVAPWDAQDGTKRQAVEIIAENTQFIGGREGGGGGGGERPADEFAPAGSAPMPTSASIADDDDIPF
jgi:single-strand DNA-binding protein